MSDKVTDLISRDLLAHLLRQSVGADRKQRGVDATIEEPSVSPLAVLFVLAMLVTLFIAIVKAS